jgi:hypothetical protein
MHWFYDFQISHVYLTAPDTLKKPLRVEFDGEPVCL